MANYIGWGTAAASALLSLVLGFVGISDEGTRFDLAEMQDGETRTFGQGENVITAIRSGETVVITLPGDQDLGRTIDCDLSGESNCFVYTADDATGLSLVLMENGGGALPGKIEITGVGSGIGSDGVFEFQTMAEDGAPGPARIHVERLGGNAGGVWVTSGVGEGDADVLVERLDGDDVRVFRIGGEPATVLRCPEGDTTMRLGADEAVGSYYCPQHNVELEQVERHFVRKVRVHPGGESVH